MKTKKVAINTRHGGFSLSPKAVRRMAELQGKPCYFFDWKRNPTTEEGAAKGITFLAYRVPNPTEVAGDNSGFHSWTLEERKASNARWAAISLESRPNNREDPLLIQVIEELGSEADGGFAELKIVEIPADVEYEIEEYDGMEHIAEKHQTWR